MMMREETNIGRTAIVVSIRYIISNIYFFPRYNIIDDLLYSLLLADLLRICATQSKARRGFTLRLEIDDKTSSLTHWSSSSFGRVVFVMSYESRFVSLLDRSRKKRTWNSNLNFRIGNIYDAKEVLSIQGFRRFFFP